MAAKLFVTGKGEQGVGESKTLEGDEQEEDSPYELSLDPDTRAAEKRLRRIVAKQVVRCSYRTKSIERN